MKMNVPKIGFPGLSQGDFEEAFEVLESCKITDLPKNGFAYPFFGPGGLYGDNWWNIDSSVALSGYKWVDQKFAEDGIRNFILSQRKDGRICLYGSDEVPGYAEQISSLPKLVEVTYDICKRSSDLNFVESACSMCEKYIGWWFAKRRDERTGLITAVFEETFVPYLNVSGVRAAVDTNIELVVACNRTAELLKHLRKDDRAQALLTSAKEIQRAVNRFMWNEERGAYFPCFVKDGSQEDFLMVSTFLPLRYATAPAARRARLLTLLTDDSEFNWDSRPLTSASKKDPQFVVTEGDYQFNASWSGSVWTLPNEAVIKGLRECGEDKLAAELAYRTVRLFHNNYTEFANPFDGSGHGVKRYAWTASHYIELIVEQLFGIDYSFAENRLTVRPNLPETLRGETLNLSNLVLPCGNTLDVRIDFSDKIKIDCKIFGTYDFELDIADQN